MKLPWPPTLEIKQQIAQELKEVLSRSKVPEAAELVPNFPETDVYFDPAGRYYVDEWRLADDGCSLWTGRIRTKFIRHQYEVHFSQKDGKWIGSELVVRTGHRAR